MGNLLDELSDILQQSQVEKILVGSKVCSLLQSKYHYPETLKSFCGVPVELSTELGEYDIKLLSSKDVEYVEVAIDL